MDLEDNSVGYDYKIGDYNCYYVVKKRRDFRKVTTALFKVASQQYEIGACTLKFDVKTNSNIAILVIFIE